VSPQVTETFDAETSHLIEGFNDTFKEYGFNPTDKEALVAEFVSRSDEVSDSLTLENLFKTIIQREYLTTKLDAAMGLASGESLAQLYSMKSDQLLGVIGNESLQGMFEKMNITFTDNLKNFMGTLHESRILNAGSTFKESLEKAMLDGNLKVYTDRVDVTIPGGMFTQPTTISIALNK